MNIKKEIDPHNTLSFTAPRSLVTFFKRKHKIVSRNVTHKVTTRVDVDAAAVQTTAAGFIHEIRSFIAEQELTPEQVLNTDQSRFDKDFHSGRTVAMLDS